MADKAYSWCPDCKRWVPESLMNYDVDPETNQLTRVCTPCLEGAVERNNFVLDAHHEQTACVYCGSYDTVEQAPNWLWFQCNSCKEKFRRI